MMVEGFHCSLMTEGGTIVAFIFTPLVNYCENLNEQMNFVLGRWSCLTKEGFLFFCLFLLFWKVSYCGFLSRASPFFREGNSRLRNTHSACSSF